MFLQRRSFNILIRSDSSVVGSYKGDLLTLVNLAAQINVCILDAPAQ